MGKGENTGQSGALCAHSDITGERDEKTLLFLTLRVMAATYQARAWYKYIRHGGLYAKSSLVAVDERWTRINTNVLPLVLQCSCLPRRHRHYNCRTIIIDSTWSTRKSAITGCPLTSACHGRCQRTINRKREQRRHAADIQRTCTSAIIFISTHAHTQRTERDVFRIMLADV